MKNRILSGFISIFVFVISFATNSFARENDFFFKANLGYSKLNKVHSYSAKRDFSFGVGVGYHYLNNVRIDLTFDHFIGPKWKKDNKTISGDANTFMLNGFVDLFDLSIAKIFTGAGAGFGYTKASFSGDPVAKNNGKVKANYSLAYAAYLGASVEFFPGATAELIYSYRHLGKTKEFQGSSIKFEGQNLAAGIRIDF